MYLGNYVITYYDVYSTTIGFGLKKDIITLDRT